ncbi:MAG: ABC transporter ATP-binding protein [Spirochaetales bacterium]|jgi:ABC-2 type transport system ATP-binding protein|nr:ABC transporter ATP-binding protein [Spirochaetales bacterium]
MISIRNLSKSYGSVPAVEGISLEVPRAQILGLLGPNGAGKSTTLRIITGYLKPTSGEVLVKGRDAASDPLGVKSLIGYLPESAPLYGEMLVFDYLDYIAGLRGLEGEKKLPEIRRLGRLCGIFPVMHKPINALSKGYRQRVGLAQAMMNDPEILILDEPTSGLDPNQILEIRRIIREIGKQKTIIFSTHILSEAEAVCDRVVIINKGRIAADGPADSLQSSLKAEQTLHLCLKAKTAEEVERALKPIPGVLSFEASASGDLFRARIQSASDIREELYRCIRAQDWILLEFSQEKKSLETIFAELTQGE